jgi:hypothetical protein
MSFFNFGKTAPNSSFGYKINSVDGIPTELEAVKGNILKTNKKYREELSKYREIAKFNQQISNGYIRNLEAMVDVSRILNYYSEIFNVLRSEFEKNEQVLGTALRTSDISYLERLTKSKMDELNNKFISETERLKKLYNQYGKNEELQRVVDAQNNLRATSEVAEQAYSKVKQIEDQGMAGGKKLKRFVTHKKQVVKKKTQQPTKTKSKK